MEFQPNETEMEDFASQPNLDQICFTFVGKIGMGKVVRN